MSSMFIVFFRFRGRNFPWPSLALQKNVRPGEAVELPLKTALRSTWKNKNAPLRFRGYFGAHKKNCISGKRLSYRSFSLRTINTGFC